MVARRRRFMSFATPPSTPPAVVVTSPKVLPPSVAQHWSYTSPPPPLLTSSARPTETVITIKAPIQRKRKTKQPFTFKSAFTSAFNILKLFLLVFIFLFHSIPSSSSSFSTLSSNHFQKRALSDVDPFTVLKLKSTVMGMLQGSHYGPIPDEESIEEFQDRMTLNPATMLLCIPVILKYLHQH